MKHNIGISDRIIRFILFDLLMGASLTGMYFPAEWSTPLFLIALMIGISVVTAYSPLYQVIGWDTRDEAIKSSEEVKA